MADVFIRTYESRDYDVVRELFAQGMMDYLPSTFMYLLRLRQGQMTILVSVIASYLVFGSFLVSSLGLVALLAGTFWIIKFVFQKRIDKTYKDDLQSIEESYMLGQNSCFWVAEANGRVVGIVGVQPVQDSRDEVVLRRLSVAKDQRHKGIGRRLCRQVIEFARQRGYRHVTLTTLTIRHAAQKLYVNMGFRETKSAPVSHPVGRLANVSRISYTYDIKT